MSETSTTAGTWAPDWTVLAEIVHQSWHQAMGNARSVIEEYQRQAAAAGLVMVLREDLERARPYLATPGPGPDPLGAAACNRLLAALAATPEPAPGGDGS